MKLKLKGAKLGNQEIYSLYFTDFEGKHVLKISVADVRDITIVNASSAAPVDPNELLLKKKKSKISKKDKKDQESKQDDDEKIEKV